MNNLNTLGKDIPIELCRLNYKTKSYIANFQSGNQQIDDYFRNRAIDDWDTVTYIYLDTNRDIPIACVSLCCSSMT